MWKTPVCPHPGLSVFNLLLFNSLASPFLSSLRFCRHSSLLTLNAAAQSLSHVQLFPTLWTVAID